MGEVDSAEFTYWIAYNRVDPFGEDRADWRAGHAAAAVYNVNRSGNSDPARATDFILKHEADTGPTAGQVEDAIDNAMSALMVI